VKPESSVELLARVRAGDPDALNDLLERYLPRLRRWASGRLPAWARERGDTDDLVQDTVLQTLRRLDDFQPRHDGALQAYLRQAIHNRICDLIRRAKRRPAEAALEDDMIDAGASPLERAIGSQALERYDSALAGLEADDQQAIIGRLELGYDYEELAAALGKPSSEAARQAVRRALLRLAARMKDAAT
jgi:RNA polymerase sigma-70 factor (ECF subfamily)